MYNGVLWGLAAQMARTSSSSSGLRAPVMPTMGWLERQIEAELRGFTQHSAAPRPPERKRAALASTKSEIDVGTTNSRG